MSEQNQIEQLIAAYDADLAAGNARMAQRFLDAEPWAPEHMQACGGEPRTRDQLLCEIVRLERERDQARAEVRALSGEHYDETDIMRWERGRFEVTLSSAHGLTLSYGCYDESDHHSPLAAMRAADALDASE